MKYCFTKRLVGLALFVMVVSLLALGIPQTSAAQAADLSTQHMSAISQDMNVFMATPDSQVASCQVPTAHRAAGYAAPLQSDELLTPQYAPLSDICCAWLYWCDYYACYYIEDCWYC
jgi:hypothetical protein